MRYPAGNGLAPSDIRVNLREKRQTDADFKGPQSSNMQMRKVLRREIDFEDVSLPDESEGVEENYANLRESGNFSNFDKNRRNSSKFESFPENSAKVAGLDPEKEGNEAFLGRTQGEGLFKQRLERFRRFGALRFCYRHPKSKLPTLLAARVRGIFLGYSRESNSYLVLSLIHI